MDVFATYWQRLTRIVGWDDAGISGGRGEGSYRVILATARPSCYFLLNSLKAAFHDTDTDSPDATTSLRPTRAISSRQSSRGCRCRCRSRTWNPALTGNAKQSVASVHLSVCPFVSIFWIVLPLNLRVSVCMWVMILARLELKVRVVGQSRGVSFKVDCWMTAVAG